jgi:hypothetical protein
MAESVTKEKTKRGSVAEHIDRIRYLVANTPRKKEGKIPWADIARQLAIEGAVDSAKKAITGRKLLEVWTNYLDPTLTKHPFKSEEWETLIGLYIEAKQQGRRGRKSSKYLLPSRAGVPLKWVGLLPGRSPNMVKNLYNSPTFIQAAEAAAENGGQVVLPEVPVIPEMEPSQETEFDVDDYLALVDEGLLADVSAGELQSISVDRSGQEQPPPLYTPPPPYSPFRVEDFDQPPGGASAVDYSGFSGFSSPSSSIGRTTYPGFGSPFRGGKAYKKSRKSSRKARKSSRKAHKKSSRKLFRKARKSSRK